MLKLVQQMMSVDLCFPAAFGRLCVETKMKECNSLVDLPAAFGRLCVETKITFNTLKEDFQPPSGGCVLKQSLVA